MTSHLCLGPAQWGKSGPNTAGVAFRCSSPRLPVTRAQTPPSSAPLAKWTRQPVNCKGSAAFVQTSARIELARSDTPSSTMPLQSWIKRGEQPSASYRSATPRLYTEQLKADGPPSTAPLQKWGPKEKRPSASFTSKSDRFSTAKPTTSASAECTAPLMSWKAQTPATAAFKMTGPRSYMDEPTGGRRDSAGGPGGSMTPLPNWTKRTGAINRPSAGMLSTTPRHSYIPKKDPNV